MNKIDKFVFQADYKKGICPAGCPNRKRSKCLVYGSLHESAANQSMLGRNAGCISEDPFRLDNEEAEADAVPSWWPENPYSEAIFTMTDKEYVEAVPDEDLRTRISGLLMRSGWDNASREILERMREHEHE